MANQEIAQTIIRQLGGNRFVAMTGSKDFVSSDNSLRFKVGRGAKNGISHVKVTLDGMDTYTIEATKYSARSLKVTKVAEIGGVYWYELPVKFTKITGFDTKL